MKECISREAALAALKEYNKEPFHILHGLTVEGVMRCMPTTWATARTRTFGPR